MSCRLVNNQFMSMSSCLMIIDYSVVGSFVDKSKLLITLSDVETSSSSWTIRLRKFERIQSSELIHNPI